MKNTVHILFIVCSLFAPAYLKDSYLEEAENNAKTLVDRLDLEYADRIRKVVETKWDYDTDITDVHEDAMIQADKQFAFEEIKISEEVNMLKWCELRDRELMKKLKRYRFSVEDGLLRGLKYEVLLNLKAQMMKGLQTRVCEFDTDRCKLRLDPDVVKKFAESRDSEELQHYWLQIHDNLAVQSKQIFSEYVLLKNEAAQANDYKNTADMWADFHGGECFEQKLKIIMEEITPLYQQLHAYVRKRLWDHYGDSVMSRTGPIPAHLLGSPWADKWSEIEDLTMPYSDKQCSTLTELIIRKNFGEKKMSSTIKSFYSSIDLDNTTYSFLDQSPELWRTQNISCMPQLYNFYNDSDIRLKMCFQKDVRSFKTLQTQIGLLQTEKATEDQPIVFTANINNGIPESIASAVSMSMMTPKHLNTIGLNKFRNEDEQSEINHLFQMALEYVSNLPFTYFVDKFRYSIFRLHVTDEMYNCFYWYSRQNIQGIMPPTFRNEKHFDQGLLIPIANDKRTNDKFIATIMQFTIHKKMCQKIKQYIPRNCTKKLHDCNIYQNMEAGQMLMEIMKMVPTSTYEDINEYLTGSRSMTARDLLHYFEPLTDWLKQENERTGEKIGWDSNEKHICTDGQLEYIKLVMNRT